MLRRDLIPVSVSIIILASMYLMGQGWSPEPSGPPAPVAKTGQTTSYATGDDGDLQKGVAWPDPRFTHNGDGTVTDNLTGLVWTQDADCDGPKDWHGAIDYCNALAQGTCGLTDGSVAGDWRLANRFELESLLDLKNCDPALPTGHPFMDVHSNQWFWSSTSVANMYGTAAWNVWIEDGFINYSHPSGSLYVWCVRGGQ